MKSSFFVVVRSARLYVWAVVGINVVIVSWTLGAGVGAAVLAASALALLASF